MKPVRTISDSKIKKYLAISERAFDGLTLTKKESIDCKKAGEDFLDMAKRYFEDAKYYYKKGDYVTSFAAVNYAHGYLDAGARLGLFKVKHREVFAIDENDENEQKD